MATEAELRKKYVTIAQSYVGAVQGSAKHKKIVSLFNSVKPGGEVMYNSWPWCAASTTAWAIQAFGSKADVVFPLDYNVGNLVSKAKAMGAWVERDTYAPKSGDLVIFSWSPNTTGELTTGASHVGVVESVKSGYIHTIEGNKGTSHTCLRRSFPIGWVYIRGFIVPRYGKIASVPKKTTHTNKAKTKSASTSSRTLYKVVAKKGLNARAGAGTKYRIKTAIPYATKVYIYKQKNGWGYSKALNAWLSMAYLKKA